MIFIRRVHSCSTDSRQWSMQKNRGEVVSLVDTRFRLVVIDERNRLLMNPDDLVNEWSGDDRDDTKTNVDRDYTMNDGGNCVRCHCHEDWNHERKSEMDQDDLRRQLVNVNLVRIDDFYLLDCNHLDFDNHRCPCFRFDHLEYYWSIRERHIHSLKKRRTSSSSSSLFIVRQAFLSSIHSSRDSTGLRPIGRCLLHRSWFFARGESIGSTRKCWLRVFIRCRWYQKKTRCRQMSDELARLLQRPYRWWRFTE